ncbi:MAG: hypothetical protein PQJ49_05940 [Sphaerochaetaceae bacterium]|nr:hypothetical protein [Sphaerochaetaceae bacterium]
MFALITVGIFCVMAVVLLLIRKAHIASVRNLKETFGRIPDEEHDMKRVSSYHVHAIQADEETSFLDSTTWGDLSMDSVYQRINACHCSIGDEYLYHVLHDVHTPQSTLESRYLLKEWLSTDEVSRLRLQKILVGIGKRPGNGLGAFIFYPFTKRLGNDWIYVVLAMSPLVACALLSLSIQISMGILICSVCLNILVSVNKTSSLESELESLRYFSSLVHGAKMINREFASRLNEMCESGTLGDDLEISLAPFRRMRGVLPGSMNPFAAEVEVPFLVLKAVFLMDLIRYNRTVGLMIAHNQELQMLYKIIGELDMAVSSASFCASIPWYCKPHFDEENFIVIENGYHPLVSNPVPNSVVLKNDSILTGSNASGKSTFIKMIAVNHILAQSLFICCAKEYSLGRAFVISSMALRDNIEIGESYFMAEIRSLRRIMDECKKQRCVCFIDEILRGTNTPERIAASTAVLRVLHKTQSMCLVASHDIELTEILDEIYDNYHFIEHFEKDEVVFDYLLKKGPSKTRNAIRLLEYMGFDEQVVIDAREMLGEK